MIQFFIKKNVSSSSNSFGFHLGKISKFKSTNLWLQSFNRQISMAKSIEKRILSTIKTQISNVEYRTIESIVATITRTNFFGFCWSIRQFFINKNRRKFSGIFSKSNTRFDFIRKANLFSSSSNWTNALSNKTIEFFNENDVLTGIYLFVEETNNEMWMKKTNVVKKKEKTERWSLSLKMKRGKKKIKQTLTNDQRVIFNVRLNQLI